MSLFHVWFFYIWTSFNRDEEDFVVIEDIKIILSEEIQEFIHKHDNDDVDKLMLSKKYSHLPIGLIAEQIKTRKKSQKKFPTINNTIRLYSSLSFEQSSSEATAIYKSKLLTGANMIDMTGGFGVDAYYLADKFSSLVYCERNETLAEMFRVNFARRRKNMKIIVGDSIKELENYTDDYFDWIFIDPARREENRKTVDLEYCSPNIYDILDLMKKKARKICIKVSPAFDFTEAKRKLPGLYEYIVISVDNECKEILLLIDRNENKNVIKKAVGLNSFGEVTFEHCSNDDVVVNRKIVNAAGKYFYEPDLSIIKAGLSEDAASIYDLVFLNEHADYLTGDALIEDFPGRKFEVAQSLPYKSLKKYLRENEIKKANIARRNFKLSVSELRKELKIKEGGKEYFFFTENAEGKSTVIHARPV